MTRTLILICCLILGCPAFSITSAADTDDLEADAEKAVAEQRLTEARDLFSGGDPVGAAQKIRQALEQFRRIGDRAGEAKALKELGNTYHAQSDYPAATELQRQALSLARELGLAELQCRVLVNLAGLARDQAALDDAERLYREARTLAQRLQEPGLDAMATAGLGSTLYRKGAYAGAASVLTVAVQLARDTGQAGVQAAAAAYLGRAREALEHHSLAADAYGEALALARKLGNRDGVLTLLTARASASHRAGDLRAALEYAAAALRLSEEVGGAVARSNAAAALGVLTATSTALGKTEDGLAQALRQLEIARTHGDAYLEGVAAESVSAAELALGRYVESMAASTRMLALGRRLGDSTLVGKALRNLGQAYLSVGEMKQAEERFREQLQAARSAADRQQTLDALQNLGDLAIQRGDYAAAVDLYEQNRRAARQGDDAHWLTATLNRLAGAHHYLGHDAETLEYAGEALRLSRETDDAWQQWRALQTLGRTRIRLGDESGIADLQALVELSGRLGVRAEHLALVELGGAWLLLGRYGQAEETLLRSLRLSRALGDPESEGMALEQLAAVRLETGELAQAERHLRDALEVWESLRAGLGERDVFKVSIFERQAGSYQQLQKVLLARGKPKEALEVAERGRARAFVELLLRRLTPGALPEVRAPSSDEIIAAAAEKNATIVEYSILNEDDRLLIWVVGPSGSLSVRDVALADPLLGSARSLEYLVRDSRHRLGARGIGSPATLDDLDGDQDPTAGGNASSAEARGARRTGRRATPAEVESPLRHLHRLLVEPIADLLPDDPDALVVFVPQGPLFLVPFAALQDVSGDYLVARHRIATAPSIQVLELAADSPGSETEVQVGDPLVVGNPVMAPLADGSAPLPALPGAEEEAMRVAGLLGTRALTGAAAHKREIVARMPEAHLIHLATHGLFDDERGLGSAVVLAPSAGNDGLLTAEEISDMRLSADLVVLSACNTGRGRITGDGVIGLSRAFLSSGVPSVLVSLWSVPDAPTLDLMTAFYRQLDEDPDRARALRRAMLSVMQEHPDPLSWAGFVLIGAALP